MAKRWVIGGLAVGVGALVLAPEARTWLRRRLGLEPEDRRWFEEEGVENAEHEGDEPLDTREARFSLRARLAEEGHAGPEDGAPPAAAEPSPEPSPFPAFEQPAPDLALAEEPVSEAPASEEPAAEEAAAEEPPAIWEPAAEAPAVEEPFAVGEPFVVEEPAAEPEPRPMWPSAVPPAPDPEPEPLPSYASYEAVPAITPDVDEPRAPGEDTNEIDPLPSTSASEDPAEDEAPPPPPTLLRPPTSPRPSRPFSSEGASFRSAIDAARERVHGAAREATPDDDEGDNTEPIEERS